MTAKTEVKTQVQKHTKGKKCTALTKNKHILNKVIEQEKSLQIRLDSYRSLASDLNFFLSELIGQWTAVGENHKVIFCIKHLQISRIFIKAIKTKDFCF